MLISTEKLQKVQGGIITSGRTLSHKIPSDQLLKWITIAMGVLFQMLRAWGGGEFSFSRKVTRCPVVISFNHKHRNGLSAFCFQIQALKGHLSILEGCANFYTRFHTIESSNNLEFWSSLASLPRERSYLLALM